MSDDNKTNDTSELSGMHHLHKQGDVYVCETCHKTYATAAEILKDHEGQLPPYHAI